MSHLEYMQEQGAKNIDFHIQNMENLQKEANTTATFLYVIISASFTGALKLFTGGEHKTLAVGLSLLCIYLAILGMYLVFSCLKAEKLEPPTNEPSNLKLTSGYTSEQIQEFELKNLQERINKNRIRNENTAASLNRVRVLICTSPIVFLIATFCVGLLRLALSACFP